MVLDFKDFEATSFRAISPLEQLMKGKNVKGVCFSQVLPTETKGSLELAARRGFIGLSDRDLKKLNKVPKFS